MRNDDFEEHEMRIKKKRVSRILRNCAHVNKRVDDYSFFCRPRARITSSNIYLPPHQIVIYHLFIYHRTDFIVFCGTYWESKNWLFSDLSRWTIYHSYIFISPNLSNCCQVSKQAEIWPVQAEIIDHPVPRFSMFDPTELRWTTWRSIKLKKHDPSSDKFFE